jgi:hypothetical protein
MSATIDNPPDATPSSAELRAELHRLADAVPDEELDLAVELVRDIVDEAAEVVGSQPVLDGDGDESEKPLWGIAGIGHSREPSNIAKYKDQYLVDGISAKSPV